MKSDYTPNNYLLQNTTDENIELEFKIGRILQKSYRNERALGSSIQMLISYARSFEMTKTKMLGMVDTFVN